MFPDIIVLDSSTTFQTYNLISYNISYDHSHIPLLFKKKNEQEKKKKIKNQIKEN